MGVLSPSEGYVSMVKYASHKAKLPVDRFLLQSFMAGFWVAVYGHCCTHFSGLFFKSQLPLPKLIYGILFPGAFIAVALTGTELFTGNTVAMMLFLLNGAKRKSGLVSALAAIKVWAMSLIGNFTGAVIGALVLSHASGVFRSGDPMEFLSAMGKAKIEHGFVSNLSLAIGCNMLVCLATWCTLIIEDGAGKILAMWFTVGVFAMGGYEHIVANFYTLSLYMMTVGGIKSLASVVVQNWIPVCLGNAIAGFVFTGFTWWYSLSPCPGRSVDVDEVSDSSSFNEDCDSAKIVAWYVYLVSFHILTTITLRLTTFFLALFTFFVVDVVFRCLFLPQ